MIGFQENGNFQLFLKKENLEKGKREKSRKLRKYICTFFAPKVSLTIYGYSLWDDICQWLESEISKYMYRFVLYCYKNSIVKVTGFHLKSLRIEIFLFWIFKK